jgi:hypothetical protein
MKSRGLIPFFFAAIGNANDMVRATDEFRNEKAVI